MYVKLELVSHYIQNQSSSLQEVISGHYYIVVP